MQLYLPFKDFVSFLLLFFDFWVRSRVVGLVRVFTSYADTYQGGFLMYTPTKVRMSPTSGICPLSLDAQY